jgi:glycosyltransferase involved in cell wall biosynthesis
MDPICMPLVSVIIPCYNSGRWLQETLDTVVAQTWQKLEIILVDDGSQDNTATIIKQFESAHPHLVRAIFGPNCGAASARNTGLAQARGDYIQFLDADDLLMPEAIALKVAALQASGGDMAYSDWQKLEEKAGGLFEPGECVTRTIEQVDPDPQVALFTSFWAPPVALLYTRSIVQAIGGWKQQLAPIEDARYMLDAVFHGGRYVHVPGILALYRIFEGPSHSRRSPLKFVSAVLHNALEVEQIWHAKGRLDAGHRQVLGNCYDYVARTLFRLDPAQFYMAIAALYRQRPSFEPTWPKIANLLKQIFGTRLAMVLLSAMGKGN